MYDCGRTFGGPGARICAGATGGSGSRVEGRVSGGGGLGRGFTRTAFFEIGGSFFLRVGDRTGGAGW
jgi:hypothetical protein